MEMLSHRVCDVLRAENACVLLSGAGTSGRIAVACSRLLNQVFGTTKARYLIAGISFPEMHRLMRLIGGDEVLVRPRENVEDNVAVAVTDIQALEVSYERIVYIGVSVLLLRCLTKD